MNAEGPVVNAMRRPDWAALVIALILVVLAIVVATDVMRLSDVATYARIGPQTVPYVIAFCLAGLGGWTAIEALRGDFPEREPQEARPVLWIVAGLVAQIALLRLVGFSIATGVLFGFVAYGMGRRPLWLGVPAGIVAGLIVWLFFRLGLSLSLPGGPVETAATAALASLIEMIAKIIGDAVAFIAGFSA